MRVLLISSTDSRLCRDTQVTLKLQCLYTALATLSGVTLFFYGQGYLHLWITEFSSIFIILNMKESFIYLFIVIIHMHI